MLSRSRWLVLAACVLLAGCSGGNDAGGDDTGTALRLSGKIGAAGAGRVVASLAGRSAADAVVSSEGFQVIAQSNQTAVTYRGTTGADGSFQIDIPDAEIGNTFVVSILGADGRAVGPVLYGRLSDASGVTGLTLDGEVSLGTIQLPADPTTDPIEPGDDADADLLDRADPGMTVRLNEQGVPVGLATCGKGGDAMLDEQAGDTADGDMDGLVDMLDADDDGDGVVDDFDPDANMTGQVPPGLTINFFMNLKIQAEQAPIYYAGTAEQIAARLAEDTVITFETFSEETAPLKVQAARVLETPGPGYLPSSEVLTYGGPERPVWASADYALPLNSANGRFEAFIVPMATMNSGDTFTVEITFEDGSTAQFSRMINYVFKNIPRLVAYGTTEGLTAFDVNDPTINGSLDGPIPLDPAEDLVLVFNPPKDETGAYLTQFGYSFQVFYYDQWGGQLNQEIDRQAT